MKRTMKTGKDNKMQQDGAKHLKTTTRREEI